MSKNWDLVPLQELLNKSDNWIEIKSTEDYKQITVKIWGKGVVLRDNVKGADIASSKRLQVKAGQFIVSRIDARHGAFGIIPQFLDGGVVTNDFPVFDFNLNRVEPKFLEWLSKTAYFVEICQKASEGTTNRVRLKENKFLSMKIPLPPLEEQRRIVGKIERLAEKIGEVRSLRLQTIKETEALLNSCYNEIFSYKKHWQQLKIKDFCHPTQYGYTESAVNEAIGPHFLRITDIQNGQVNWEKVPFCYCPNSEPYLLQKNDILFARTGGTTGKTFLIKDCPKSVFASYLIRLRVKDSVIPEYLYNYFQSPAYWKQIIDQKTGTGQPNVNGKKLSNLIVPIPPLSEQKRIVEYLDRLQSKIEIMKKEREKALEETKALLPSILDKAFKGEL